jgi:nucleoside-diphosphate-sugar epimerase
MPAGRVLVTGVSGFVGGALGQHLLARGHRVAGISRREPRPGTVSEFFARDLSRPLDQPDCAPVDAVVHCAALSSPWAAPAAFRAHNVDATRHVLEWAARTGARRFVFISSSSVYYQAGVDQTGISEDSPLPAIPINQYAATKREAEDLVRQSSLEWVILRPRAVFGPGDTVLFPRILRAARRGALPRIVRPSGDSPLADLIYIDNLSYYIERSLSLDIERSLSLDIERSLSLDSAAIAGRTFNLTNNQPVALYPFLDDLLARLDIPRPKRSIRVSTALAFARAAELVSQHLLNYREPPITRFGVEVMAYSKTFDVSRMLAAFGPPPISIETGVERFLAWQRTQWSSR